MLLDKYEQQALLFNKSYSPKYASVTSFVEAMAKTADIKREDRGPV